MKIRCCLFCLSPFVGRSDKKYCSSPCRHKHKNLRNKKKFIRQKLVLSSIRRNEKILLQLYHLGIRLTTKKILLDSCFDFRFSTHHFHHYQFMYCMGYKPLDDGDIQIVKQTSDEFEPPN